MTTSDGLDFKVQSGRPRIESVAERVTSDYGNELMSINQIRSSVMCV